MSPSHRKFGDLLEEGIKRVHINRKKPIGYILDEFGYELRPEDSSKGRHALGHWYYKKRIPANLEDLTKLAELIVKNSDVERDWLKAFLESGGYTDADGFCDRFFVRDTVAPRPVDTLPSKSGLTESAPSEVSQPDQVPSMNQGKRRWIWYMAGGIGLLGIVAVILVMQRPVMDPASEVSPTMLQASPTIAHIFTETRIAITEPAVESPTVQPITPTPDFASFDGSCPPDASTSVFAYDAPRSFQDFLNTGGSLLVLQTGFNELVQNKVDLQDGRIVNIDLTGDGVDEVIISAILRRGSFWQILGCNSGRYEALAEISDPDLRYLRFAVDLTGDKLPEIIGYHQTQPDATQLFEFFVEGWDGHNIIDLVDTARFDKVGGYLPADITDWQRAVANATVTTRDVNGDGLFEVVVTGGLITPVPTCETRFERQFTEVWAWNGRSFQLVERLYMPPIYRFQRAADGDLAFALNQLDVALLAYQNVLFDANLFRGDEYLSHLEYCKGLGSALDRQPVENEREQLEAYARWRILLINSMTSSPDAVQVVYQTLQEKFPDGTPGHSYAAIASVFWEAYNENQGLEAACKVANEVAGAQELYPGHAAKNMCFVP